MEYGRKEAETDPLTGSVVSQLVELADSLDAFNVTLNIGTSGLGFNFVGLRFGDNLDPQDKLSICVKQILDQGTAQKDGRIQPGDQIIEVNGKTMVGVTYQEAVDILKSVTGKVSLRMGRRRPSVATPEGLPQRELVQMGASFQGPSTAIGHHSGHINDDHRQTDGVTKKAALTAHAYTRRDSSSDEEQARKTEGKLLIGIKDIDATNQLSEEEIQRTIEVNGLPGNVDLDEVYGFFENARFGGGEIARLELQSTTDGATFITFKDETAESCSVCVSVLPATEDHSIRSSSCVVGSRSNPRSFLEETLYI